MEENGRRNRRDSEYELLDTGVFDEDRYFDIFCEYAKAGAEDIVIRISAINRGPAEAELSILPTGWFRNTWSWGRDDYRPSLRAIPNSVFLRRTAQLDRRLLKSRTRNMESAG